MLRTRIGWACLAAVAVVLLALYAKPAVHATSTSTTTPVGDSAGDSAAESLAERATVIAALQQLIATLGIQPEELVAAAAGAAGTANGGRATGGAAHAPGPAGSPATRARPRPIPGAAGSPAVPKQAVPRSPSQPGVAPQAANPPGVAPRTANPPGSAGAAANPPGSVAVADRAEVIATLLQLVGQLGIQPEELLAPGCVSLPGAAPDAGGKNPAVAPPPAAECSAAPGSPAANDAITIANFTFGAERAVQPGATVRVVNMDSVAHNLTADDGSFATSTLAPGQSTTFSAPAAPGRYGFSCTIHPQMRGALTVTGGTGNAAAGAEAPSGAS